jgi:dynein heavy chain
MKDAAYKVNDFQWQSKLRPKYLTETKKGAATASIARFNICDASFDYGFEYLGNGPRLVVTPLTDRIYVTATQALNLHMGCAPAGPAGTGKTETTKDLASALGKCCYVFNCSPEMDYQSMGNIFKGLAASGSWGCFDEFNRLIPEVLSVCSVQFKAVCDGLKVYNENDESTHVVTIEGDTVGLDPTCGSFITMNPGYLGRSELPEGLKALFRPITVIVPDLVLICENMLMAEGFQTAKVLASKFYGLYSLLADLLSKQPHYDWGLRAVKSVLVVAGVLRRAEPDLDEDALLMRALRDFNIPKIVQADEVVFFGLLNDLFPGLNPPRVFDEELSECVTQACEANGLWPDAFFTLKVMQLDELLDIRHCVFVMGPPGSGKSTCWKMLQAARNMRHPDQKVKTVDINPKTMPTEDLYGHISMATREWKDGLLSR